MKFDYHMHFEYGDYDLNWVEKFFETAKKIGLDEIGISEHTHTFPEFEKFYYDDLILDNSEVGDRSTTAAGSVITQRVPENSLGVGRARQKNIADWSLFNHHHHKTTTEGDK